MWGNWLCGKWLKTLCCQTCLVLEHSKIFDEAIRIYDISHVINQILNWWLDQARPRGGLSCLQWVQWFPTIMSSTWCSMSAFHSTLAWTIKMTVRSGKNLLEFTWFVDNWYHYVIQSVLCICIRCIVAGLPSGTEWGPQWHSVHQYEYQQPGLSLRLHQSRPGPTYGQWDQLWNLIITPVSLGKANMLHDLSFNCQ